MDIKLDKSFLLVRVLLAVNLIMGTQYSYGQSTEQEPSVEQNIKAMDKDKDGMVSTEEMKVYLQTLHGSSYQQEALDSMEASMSSKSCGSPFSHSFY